MPVRVHSPSQRARRMLTERARRARPHWRLLYGTNEADARYEAFLHGLLEMQRQWDREAGR